MTNEIPTIIGAGLAGSEAAWQLAIHGKKVRLLEMRPAVMTKAHKTGLCAELVCSNSLRGISLTNAVGLLKEELKVCGSLIMEAAQATQVPAGGALAVDREGFSRYIDNKIREHPNICFETREVVSLSEVMNGAPLIIASGPLTSEPLAREIEVLVGGQNLSFFDAISPVISYDSLDHWLIFRQSRYGKGSGDEYLNVPLNKEEYEIFVNDILKAEKFSAHSKIDMEDIKPFEGCMPIEDMAARGMDTIRHGPLKPVGLIDPNTNRRPYAVIQLRQDNSDGTLWNMVGMQTRMKHGEQTRIFKKISALRRAEFVRLGSIHRNTFINSPRILNSTLEMRSHKGVFFAGQITGVEGYVESTACGLVAGINALRFIKGEALLEFPINTATGSLINYIVSSDAKTFQPMNISFGLIAEYLHSQETNPKPKIPKDTRRLIASKQALETLEEFFRGYFKDDLTQGKQRDELQI